MFRIRKIIAALFSQALYALAYLVRWKRKIVFTNLQYTSKEIATNKSALFFYKKLLKNITRHVGELLFCFCEIKKLPSDFFSYPYGKNEWKFEIAKDSIEVLKKMQKGGIFLTAHYGNYEFIGPWLCCLKVPLVASYIPVRPNFLNRILEKKIRSVNGYRYSINTSSPREFLRLLKNGNLFCLLADQDSRISSALEGHFLGKKVSNNPLPQFLLKHTPETPVFLCWIEEKQKSRILHAIELLHHESIMDQYNSWLEMRIQENATFWYGYTHRRYYSQNPKIYI